MFMRCLAARVRSAARLDLHRDDGVSVKIW